MLIVLSPQKPLGATLHDWAGVENHLMKHDTGRTKGYADDIDTLLVFAGLFSAILTAFVVQTYPMLQVDGAATTNQLLAIGVATQLRTTGTMTSAAVNMTIASLADPPAFTPGTAVRWINSLFFLSLVVSLAAALFGILSKQWLREYMEWNAPLASPRENVLVRQLRAESWDRWNVEATISAIPALLEIAMIFFLGGLTTLLWVLDSVVAIVVTVAVAIFLGAVAAFTVLPIALTRCPYKSPTAWACLRLLDFLRCTVPLYIAQQLVARFERFRYVEINESLFAVPATWRERDLDSCKVKERWWQPSRFRQARQAAQVELAKERAELSMDRTSPYQVRPSFFETGASEKLLVAIMEGACLLCALSWVGQASQDTQVRRYIGECGASIYSAEILNTMSATRISTLANWFLLLTIRRGNLHRPLSVFSENIAAEDVPDWNTDTSSIPSTVGSLRRQLNIKVSRQPDAPYLTFCRQNVRGQLDSRCFHPSIGIPFFLRLMTSSLRYAARGLREVLHQKHNSEIEIRRVVESMAALLNVTNSTQVKEEDCGFLGSEWSLEGLRILLCDDAVTTQLDIRVPCLRLQAFRMASAYARITVRGDWDNLEVSEGEMESSDWQSLLLNYFHDHDFEKCSEDDLSIFILAASEWLFYVPIPPHGAADADPTDANMRILDAMTRVAGAIIVRRLRYQGLQGRDDGDWIYGFLRNSTGLSKYNDGYKFRHLLHLLENAFIRGKLIGSEQYIRRVMNACLQEAHANADTCDAPRCQWIFNRHTGQYGDSSREGSTRAPSSAARGLDDGLEVSPATRTRPSITTRRPQPLASGSRSNPRSFMRHFQHRPLRERVFSDDRRSIHSFAYPSPRDAGIPRHAPSMLTLPRSHSEPSLAHFPMDPYDRPSTIMSGETEDTGGHGAHAAADGEIFVAQVDEDDDLVTGYGEIVEEEEPDDGADAVPEAADDVAAQTQDDLLSIVVNASLGVTGVSVSNSQLEDDSPAHFGQLPFPPMTFGRDISSSSEPPLSRVMPVVDRAASQEPGDPAADVDAAHHSRGEQITRSILPRTRSEGGLQADENEDEDRCLTVVDPTNFWRLNGVGPASNIAD